MTTVPHLPWTPQEAVQGLPPMGNFAPPFAGHYMFGRYEWPYGSFNVWVRCDTCKAFHEAGASAGERKLIRWARDHVCTPRWRKMIDADEDQKLFR